MKRTAKPPPKPPANMDDLDRITGRTLRSLYSQEVRALSELDPIPMDTIRAFLTAIQAREWSQPVPGSFMIKVRLDRDQVEGLRAIVRDHIVKHGVAVPHDGMEWIATESGIACRLPRH